MAGHQAQLLVLDPLLEGHDVAGHVPDLFNRSAALDVEGVQDVLGLGTDGGLVGDVVGDGPHLLPVELLGVEEHAAIEVGLVDVQVHHAGIGPADLGDVGVTEAAAHLGRAAPVFDLGLEMGITALVHAGDDRVALAGALQVGHHLAHGAAGVQLAQPGGSVGGGVLGCALLLNVHQHHGHVQVPHGGQHIVARGVGQQLQDHQVYVRGAELVARRHRQLLGGDDAAVDQLHRIGDAGLELRVLALELGHQGRELGQVGPQSDGENAHSCFGFNQHSFSSLPRGL